MRYTIILKSSVKKFLQKQQGQSIVTRFFEALEILQKDPETKELDVIFLQNTPNRYRLRIGKYRFLFWKEEEKITLTFYDAGPRGDIYK